MLLRNFAFKGKSPHQIELRFDDNDRARNLFGAHAQNLRRLEEVLEINVHSRGNRVILKGPPAKLEKAKKALQMMYEGLTNNDELMPADWDRAISNVVAHPEQDLNRFHRERPVLHYQKKDVVPKTPGQKVYMDAIAAHDLVFGVGPAGTGKTYLAMAMAVSAFLNGQVKRIILTRPAIEAGEKLGFLPGDLAEKVNPYLRPLYDAMHDMLEMQQTQRMLDRGEIEVAPLAFMRGRTLSDAFIVLDEAQNCTREQMKMFLTRIGYHSKCVITGDITQIDLPRDQESGLIHALQILNGIKGICVHELDIADVVRHPLVQSIIEAYRKEGEKKA